ncbi:MAG TPA: phosphotransferase [Solirubrobacteraceae bacterium]|nr:phosphotransferase [Solirubrobacteraceae bacterium]
MSDSSFALSVTRGPSADLALERELSRTLGRTVELLARRPLPYRSSFAIDALEIAIGGDAPVRVLLKRLDSAGLSDVAELARPAFLRDAGHELTIYREVLPAFGDGVPALYGGVADAANGRAWMLLEQIEGVPLWQLGAPGMWEEAACWLARLHGASIPRSSALRSYDDAWYERWLRRAVAFAPCGALDRIAAAHWRVRQRLAAWPSTVVHGEFYPSNVLVEDADGAARLRVVDWEMAGVGAGLLDLAALTAGWDQRGRDRLVAAYHAAATAIGGRASLAELDEALEYARLQVALQWIGWSRHWSPPAPHARDWIDEAQAAAERLGL